MEYNINRGGIVLETVHIDERTVYNSAIMGVDKISMYFESAKVIDLVVGDYVTLNNENYYLNNVPSGLKTGRNSFSYDAIFEGKGYLLNNKIFMDEGSSDFSYYGTPDEFLDLIIFNLSEIGEVFIKGVTEDAGKRLIDFKDLTVRSALTQIAQEFGFEYQIKGNTINLGKVIGETATGFKLMQGKNKGLYSLSRRPFSDVGVKTRLLVYGSSDNLPANYRGGEKRLVFEERFLDKNIDLFGVREDVIVFDDIKPERAGKVTRVDEGSQLSIYDSTLDFDLNDVKIDGQSIIIFTSGNLQGEEFNISAYNNTTKKISFNAIKEKNGYVLPNGTIKAAVGDEYKLAGIIMPQQYITAKELELKNKGQEYADKNLGVVKSIYDLNDDELFLKTNPNIYKFMKVGNFIPVKDDDLGIDEAVRIQSISFPIVAPYRVTATISNEVVYTRGEQVLIEIKNQQNQIAYTEREILKNGRTQSILREELKNSIFDTDGYFDPENIKPNSIETGMLSVGAKGQDLTLNVTIRPNHDGQVNSVSWNEGTLDHFTINENTVQSWNISGGEATGLSPESVYYIYAKCGKVGQNGILVVTTEKIKTEGTPSDYYFLIGVLSSAIDGVRWVSLTYGSTTVNGRFITTGRIVSNNGLSYFDLDTGEFRGDFKFTSGASVQSYIDQSKIDAVQQSANDASNKANEAKQYADLLVSNINVGARNLLRESNFKLEGGGYPFGRYFIINPLTVGKTYTIVVKGWSTLGNYFRAYLNGMQPVIKVESTYLDVFVSTFTLQNEGLGTILDFYHFERDSGGSSLVEWACLYEGDITPPKDWTPAPEDVQDAINEAKALALEADRKRQELANSLKSLAYLDVVEVAKLGQTVVQGGYLQNTLIDTVWLKANIVNAQEIVVSGGGITQPQLSGAINNIEIGGVNTFRRMNEISLYNGANSLNYADNGFTAVGVHSNSGLARLQNVIKSNGWWTISFEHYYEHPGFGLTVDACDGAVTRVEFPQKGWTKVSVTTLVNNYTPELYHFVNIYGLTEQTHRFRKIKVEKGNKQTPWTLSPDDVNQDISEAKNKGNIYIRGTGLNQSPMNPRLLIVEGKEIYNDRSTGFMFVSFHEDLTVYETFLFHFGDNEGLKQVLSNYNNYSPNKIVTISSYDYIHLSQGIRDELAKMGGASESVIIGRYPWAFIGQVGIGAGNGFESWTNQGAGDLSAEISVNVINGKISALQGNAQKITRETYVNNRFNALGSLAYDNLVEQAKLGSTVIQGGYLRTELINVTSLFAQYIEATNLNVTGNSKIGIFSIETRGLTTTRLSNTKANGIFLSDTSISTHYGPKASFPQIPKSAGARLGGMEEYNEGFESARIYNNLERQTQNIALTLTASGSTTSNTALEILEGNILVKGKTGETGFIRIDNGNGGYTELEVVNGLIVNYR